MEVIENQLRKIIGKQRESSSVGLLYSGGLDSSIIAKIMVSLFEPSSIALVSVGLSGSYDLKKSILGSAELGLNLYKYYLTKKRVIEAIQSLKQLNIIFNPVSLSIAIPIFLGMQKLADDFDVKTIFLGQGADELFGGYQRYVMLYKNKGLEETKKTMINDLRHLQKVQIIRERKIAHHFNLDLVYPFLDSEIIKRAENYPVTTHIVQTRQGEFIRKALLRKLARKLGLSEEITEQPKKAIQYGSGTMKLLRMIAKSNNYKNISEWFQIYFKSDDIS
ncbi:MAG: asparagine synthase C-terminal domain-containing protein [Candidatus Hodarchaeota archaeon]